MKLSPKEKTSASTPTHAPPTYTSSGETLPAAAMGKSAKAQPENPRGFCTLRSSSSSLKSSPKKGTSATTQTLAPTTHISGKTLPAAAVGKAAEPPPENPRGYCTLRVTSAPLTSPSPTYCSVMTKPGSAYPAPQQEVARPAARSGTDSPSTSHNFATQEAVKHSVAPTTLQATTSGPRATTGTGAIATSPGFKKAALNRSRKAALPLMSALAKALTCSNRSRTASATNGTAVKGEPSTGSGSSKPGTQLPAPAPNSYIRSRSWQASTS